MQLTVLVDNNTYINHYHLGEPGLCYYIEDGGEKILLDTGYSDIFLRNAQDLGVDLKAVTRLVFSHGHDDHTRGFMFLQRALDVSGLRVLAHPDCFLPKQFEGLQVGSPFEEESMDKMVRLELTTEPTWLTDKLVYLGEIPRVHAWEQKKAMGEVCRNGEWEEDYLVDDSALAYKTAQGVLVITGCSHSGICNIVSRALEVCGDNRLRGIIGGMHLLYKGKRSASSVEFLWEIYQRSLAAGVQDFMFYPAHCTCLGVKGEMIKAGLPVQEVGVGLRLAVRD